MAPNWINATHPGGKQSTDAKTSYEQRHDSANSPRPPQGLIGGARARESGL